MIFRALFLLVIIAAFGTYGRAPPHDFLNVRVPVVLTCPKPDLFRGNITFSVLGDQWLDPAVLQITPFKSSYDFKTVMRGTPYFHYWYKQRYSTGLQIEHDCRGTPLTMVVELADCTDQWCSHPQVTINLGTGEVTK